jgi:hypothetical protein
LDRAGRHCRAVTAYLFDTLHITECQVDELWSFVRKKEAHLTVAEKILTLYGDAWVWIAFAPVWCLVAAFVVGKRDQKHANTLLERLHAVSCWYIPFFTSTRSFSFLAVIDSCRYLPYGQKTYAASRS